MSLAYTDALVTAGVTASVGTVGDSYDNALAETVNGLYKTELIYSRPVWETASTVELATMGWVNWWNTQRLHETLDYRPPQTSRPPTLTPRRPHPRPSDHGRNPGRFSFVRSP